MEEANVRARRERSRWLGLGRRFTRVALLVSFAGALLAVVPPAYACSCASDSSSSPEWMRQVIELHDGGVFVGTVTNGGKVDRTFFVTMQVERVIKGEFAPIVHIDTTDKARELCGGWTPAVGDRIGLFVDGSPTEGWRADTCSLKVDPDDLLAFAPSTRPPDPGIETFGPSPPGAGSTFPLLSMAAFCVLVIAFSRVLRLRRRRKVPKTLTP
jgi:hypothetical protein